MCVRPRRADGAAPFRRVARAPCAVARLRRVTPRHARSALTVAPPARGCDPQRGQDSLVYDFCLTLTDSHDIITEGGFALLLNQDYCIRVRVSRCAYCMQQGDSVYSVAEQWRTSWLEIWGGNADILSPV